MLKKETKKYMQDTKNFIKFENTSKNNKMFNFKQRKQFSDFLSQKELKNNSTFAENKRKLIVNRLFNEISIACNCTIS